MAKARKVDRTLVYSTRRIKHRSSRRQGDLELPLNDGPNGLRLLGLVLQHLLGCRQILLHLYKDKGRVETNRVVEYVNVKNKSNEGTPLFSFWSNFSRATPILLALERGLELFQPHPVRQGLRHGGVTLSPGLVQRYLQLLRPGVTLALCDT